MLSSNSSSCNLFPENDITSKSQDPNFFSYMHLLQYDVVPCLDQFVHHTTTETTRQQTTTTAVKKNRHTKITTARGPRDRRMRLSLDVARKFFDLQDMLGYDKASRTVDWLLRSSSAAIRELHRAASFCTFEAEAECCSKIIQKSRRVERGRTAKVELKRTSVGRESRKRARERARERTSQKRRLERENSNTNATANANANATVFHESHRFPITVEDETREFFFHFNHDDSAAFLHQDEQIAEFQFNSKPWNN